MTTQMIAKLIDRPLALSCSLDASLMAGGAGMPMGIGLSSAAVLPVLPVSERLQRPTGASAVAAVKARAQAYAFAAAANGAGAGTAKGAAGAVANEFVIGQQKTAKHGKWAFRGLEPWSDPA
jgi:hypothetical protein